MAFIVVSTSTAWNAYQHLLCYSRPDLQQHVLRIILVGPLYAFSAALCLSMDENGCFFVQSVRDIWEAVVIYSFLTLIIEYMGGEHLCLHSISQREEAVPHLFPFNLFLKPIPTGSMIRVPKIGALQFVVLKPVVAAVSIVVYSAGHYEDWYYQWTLFFVYNISYSVALYALYLIYWASHEHPSLQVKKPLLKFLSVKMIVFLTFWQALLLPHAPLPGSTSRWEDLVLAAEMMVFSFLMNSAFSWREFHSGLRGVRGTSVFGKRTLKLDDAQANAGTEWSVTADQPSATGQPNEPATKAIGRSQVVQNARDAFCPRDILSDASTNFSRRYQRHVLLESAQEYELHASDALHDIEQAAAPRPEQDLKGASDLCPEKAGALKVFRARTYFIGQSLGICGPSSPGSQASADFSDLADVKTTSAVTTEEVDGHMESRPGATPGTIPGDHRGQIIVKTAANAPVASHIHNQGHIEGVDGSVATAGDVVVQPPAAQHLGPGSPSPLTAHHQRTDFPCCGQQVEANVIAV